MKHGLLMFGVATTLAIACTSGLAEAKEAPKAKAPIFVPGSQAAFKEVIPGVSKSVLWEDAAKGSYGAYTRFVPGFDAGMHTHTSDIWIVGLKGAYVYKDEAGEKRVGPGDFIRVPGGHKHSSGGDAKEGALFYEESSGKFDLVPAK
ncbi:MAG TPA: cupin domain-containing protein [Solimonas sp.]|nr:cupin domain-containing protein [Solimonas sp.]